MSDDEPRVRDLLARPPEDAAVSDPATFARLAAWFDLPSVAALIDETAPAPAEPPRNAERARKRAEALAHVDPAMVARLEAHTARADRLRRPTPPRRPWIDGVAPLLLDERQVPEIPDFDEDAPEVAIPPQLRRDLKTCTPQAFLRDLHRPDKDFYVRFEVPWDDWEGGEPEVIDPMQPVRDTLRTDYRAGTTVAPAVRTMTESAADLRGLLARPWAESKRERARRREAELLEKLGWGPGKVAASGAVPGNREDAS
jgi:hypothetical protein